ncbi:MAG: hypothetical protein AB1925_12440 [Actinomycetota bacterium]
MQSTSIPTATRPWGVSFTVVYSNSDGCNHMAYKLTLPGTFSDTSLPIFKIDPILPDSGGAVFLVDPTHPVNPWAAGLPANNGAIPNLVAAQPSLGSQPLATALGGPLPLTYFTDGLLTGAYGKMERTGKGGLHTIISQNTALGDLASHSGGKYYQAIRPVGVFTPAGGSASNGGITDYLWGTTGTDGAAMHAFFLSVWLRITRRRVAGTQATPAAGLTLTGSYTSGFNVFAFGPQGSGNAYNTYPTTPTHVEYAGNYTRLGAPVATLGNELQEVASTAYHAGGSPSKATTYLSAMDGGQTGTFGSTTTAKGNHGSFIFYRSYLEDLTVSGRTFAQVSAIDQALFTKEVLTAGGRYYNDTFTDPATIP